MSRSCQSRGGGPAEVCAWYWVTGRVMSAVCLAKESVVGGGLWPSGKHKWETRGLARAPELQTRETRRHD